MKEKDSTVLAKERVNYIPSPRGVSSFCIGFIRLLRRDLRDEDPYIRTSAARFFHINPSEVPILNLISAILGGTPRKTRKKLKGR